MYYQDLKNIYLARQEIHKLFAQKQLHLYTIHGKSKISLHLNNASIILLDSSMIVLLILNIGSAVNCYVLLPQENGTYVTAFSSPIYSKI